MRTIAPAGKDHLDPGQLDDEPAEARQLGGKLDQRQGEQEGRLDVEALDPRQRHRVEVMLEAGRRDERGDSRPQPVGGRVDGALGVAGAGLDQAGVAHRGEPVLQGRSVEGADGAVQLGQVQRPGGEGVHEGVRPAFGERQDRRVRLVAADLQRPAGRLLQPLFGDEPGEQGLVGRGHDHLRAGVVRDQGGAAPREEGAGQLAERVAVRRGGDHDEHVRPRSCAVDVPAEPASDQLVSIVARTGPVWERAESPTAGRAAAPQMNRLHSSSYRPLSS
jgi:hypothetical protein